MKKLFIVGLVLCGSIIGELQSNNDERLLKNASEGKYRNVLNLLSRHHVSPNIVNAQGETPLILAAKSNHLRVVKELLRYGADPTAADHKRKTAIDYAHRGTPIYTALLEATQDEYYDIYGHQAFGTHGTWATRGTYTVAEYDIYQHQAFGS